MERACNLEHFLNPFFLFFFFSLRSTFEEPLSPRRHPAKRQRISEEAELSHVEHNLSHIPEPQVSVTKPEMRTVGEQTTFEVQEAVEIIGAQRLAPLSCMQTSLMILLKKDIILIIYNVYFFLQWVKNWLTDCWDYS